MIIIDIAEFFPLIIKFEASTTFKYFKTLVEKQFRHFFKSLQSDWRVKIEVLNTFL